MRLFLHGFLIALNESLSDTQTVISIGMIAHLACLAEAKCRAGSISLLWLPLVVANDRRVTAMTFATRIPGGHTARDDTACIPRLVLPVAEDAPFHPVGAFGIAPARIPALLRFEIA